MPLDNIANPQGLIAQQDIGLAKSSTITMVGPVVRSVSGSLAGELFLLFLLESACVLRDGS